MAGIECWIFGDWLPCHILVWNEVYKVIFFSLINHRCAARISLPRVLKNKKEGRVEMKNFRLSYTLLHMSVEPLKSNQRTQFCTQRGTLSCNGAYIVVFYYSFFFSQWMSEGDSLGLSQPCSGQSVSMWVTACGTISCPAAQQECQGERAGGEGEDESRAMPSEGDEAHQGLSGNSTVAQIWLL